MREENKNKGSEYTEELNSISPMRYKTGKRKYENTINFLPRKIIKEGIFKLFLKKILGIL